MDKTAYEDNGMLKMCERFRAWAPKAAGLLLVCCCNPLALALEIRSWDGSGNNPDNSDWGKANTPLLRLVNADYANTDEPRGGLTSTLLNPRAISNAVAAQTQSILNSRNASDWLWQWGQFVDHDLDIVPIHTPPQPFNIEIASDDPYFSPAPAIFFNRSDYQIDINGTRQQPNGISAFIDGSNVYGSDAMRAAALRTLDGTGKLKTSTGANGETLLPMNVDGLENQSAAGADPGDFFLAGDIRANEQIGLTATHTLFVREHNRLADQIIARLDHDTQLQDLKNQFILDHGDGVHDLGDFIYQAVRKVVGAQMQKITYEEFLPMLLGPQALDPYMGYDPAINPGISNAFATAAYRVGHSMVSPQLLRLTDDPATGEIRIELRESFFNPEEIVANGIDSLLLGLARQQAQEVDTQVIDALRNFLFGPPGAGGFDLAALNIQRGRDHGIPSYSDTREQLNDLFGLGWQTISSFADLTGGEQELVGRFLSLFSGVEELDLWTGGLAETHVDGAMVGETFHQILVNQFTRSRDGDRFFYQQQEQLDELLLLDPRFLDQTTLSSIVTRNTLLTGMQDYAFAIYPVPEPASRWLWLLGLMALLWFRRPAVGRTPSVPHRPRWAVC